MRFINEARALRITEVMNDFQNLQRRISEYAPNPPPEEYYEQGYEVLRQCRAEAQAILMAPYPPDNLQVPGGPEEQEKRQLQRVLLDACARRLQAKKVYLRAVAAIRWSNARSTIFNSRASQQVRSAQLQQTNNALRSELASVTDIRIVSEFQQADSQAGYWLQEDPPLPTILNWIRSRS
ncbi:MAG: hypothetical protein Q9167_002224 [Letrouitia subvulpina]